MSANILTYRMCFKTSRHAEFISASPEIHIIKPRGFRNKFTRTLLYVNEIQSLIEYFFEGIFPDQNPNASTNLLYVLFIRNQAM